jgi:hypothetical protein
VLTLNGVSYRLRNRGIDTLPSVRAAAVDTDKSPRESTTSPHFSPGHNSAGSSTRVASGSMATEIPLNRPCLAGNGLADVGVAIAPGHSSCGGPLTARAADIPRSDSDAVDVLRATSCTDTLERSVMLLNVAPSNVVIVPSLAFASTALAYARACSTLRFCDVDPETLFLDPNDVEAVIDEWV